MGPKGMILVSLHGMKWWTFLLFLLLARWAFSQASLNLAPFEQQAFVVYLNGDTTKSVNGEPIVIDSIQEGIHEVNVLLLDSAPTLINTRITLYNGSFENLWIDNRSDTLRLVQLAGKAVEDVTDVASVEELRTVSANIQVIRNSSCALPMTAIQFEQSFEDVREELFQSKRMSKARNLISSNCLSVEQLDQLLFLIDNEEKKLELLLHAEDHIFNLSKAASLGKQFVLSKYRKQFDQWLLIVQNEG